MAIRNVEKLIQQMYSQGYDVLKRNTRNVTYTEFDIRPAIFGDAMMRSFTRAVEEAIPPAQRKNSSYKNNLTERVATENTLHNWTVSMKQHNNTLKGRSVLLGVGSLYPKAKDIGGGIILLENYGNGKIKVLHSPSASITYGKWFKGYRDAVWKIWKDSYGSAFTGGSGTRGAYDYKQTQAGGLNQKMIQKGKYPDPKKDTYFAEATHDPQRTIPLGWLAIQLPAALSPGMTFQGRQGDLVKDFLATCSLKWVDEQTGTTSTGMPIRERRLKVIPGTPNPSGPYDLKKKTGAWSLLAYEFKTFLQENFDMFDKDVAADIDGSPTFRQQVTAAAQYALIREIMQKNKRYVFTKKLKTKEPRKTRPAKKTFKSPIKRSRKSVLVAMKGKASKVRVQGQEKGQGQEASTSTAADLARLRAYIQSRLPAEVRRNMGRPALRNITSRFSNSVQLLSLQQAQSTIMAKYTYLLSPYQTFENTGRKRWPMAYNPKLLIAKSIRNLARGRIEQKLTVRRV